MGVYPGEAREREVKTILIVMLAGILAVAAVACAGCGDKGDEQVQVIEEDGRKITVEEPTAEGDPGKVTLEGEQGEQSTIEVQEQAPSEEALGAPLYPASQYVEGSGVSGTTSSGEKQISASGAEFTTADAITKVVNWYKGNLGEPMAASPENTTWMIQGQDGSIVTVIVELYDKEVKITIAKVSGDVDIQL
jgi:hypothetical protein